MAGWGDSFTASLTNNRAHPPLARLIFGERRISRLSGAVDGLLSHMGAGPIEFGSVLVLGNIQRPTALNLRLFPPDFRNPGGTIQPAQRFSQPGVFAQLHTAQHVAVSPCPSPSSSAFPSLICFFFFFWVLAPPFFCLQDLADRYVK